MLEHPETTHVLTERDKSAIELLDELDAGNCDAIVIHEDAYNYATSLNTTYCKDFKILMDDILLNVDNVVMMSTSLGEYTRDFIDTINLFIDHDTYATIHNGYKEELIVSRDGLCPREEEEPEGDFFELRLDHLLVPIVVTFLFTTIALLMKVIKQCLNDDALKSVFDDEESDIGIAEELLARMEFEDMPPLELISYLKFMKIDQMEIADALDLLPDKSELVNLCVQAKFTSGEQMIYLLSTSEVFEILEVYSNRMASMNGIDEDGSMQLANEGNAHFTLTGINDERDPKSRLIKELMIYPTAKALALSVAKKKKSLIARGQSFDIRNCLEDSSHQSAPSSNSLESSELLIRRAPPVLEIDAADGSIVSDDSRRRALENPSPSSRRSELDFMSVSQLPNRSKAISRLLRKYDAKSVFGDPSVTSSV